MVMTAVRIFRWMIKVKGGLELLEDNKVLEVLMEHDAGLAVEGLKGIRDNSIIENFQLYKMLKDTGTINKATILKEFIESNEQELNAWLIKNLLTKEQLIPTKTLLIIQVKESLYWHMHVSIK